jgi:hypothetical protein
MFEPTKMIVRSNVAIRTPNIVMARVARYFFNPTGIIFQNLVYNISELSKMFFDVKN